MKSLDRKLLRDLGRLKGQVLTIALVVACGIGAYLALVSTYRSLIESRDRYYAHSRFADLFAHVQRAPLSLLEPLREVSGVAVAEGRLTEQARVEVEGFDELARGQFVSMPPPGGLNALHLREGRLPERDDEVVVSELFAKAHQLRPGASLVALFEGRRTRLRVVAVGLSPEFVWVTPQAGWVSDDRRYGIFWLPREGLETAFRMEGAFNDLVIALAPGASRDAVAAETERLLAPYGSYGVEKRDRQPSNRMINQELEQLQSNATLFPAVFLGVAAFLINILLSRVIRIQREQIAALKALGYRNGEVGLHYLLLGGAVFALGVAIGAALGAWVGTVFVRLYAKNFRFPDLRFHFDAGVFATAVVITGAAGVLGTWLSVRRAVRLPPAEAMRPEAPPSFRKMLTDRLRLNRLLSPAMRMVARDLERQPLRTALSALGIALAAAILIAGNMGFDSIDRVLWNQFERVQREDLEVTFTQTLPERAVLDVGRIPGVLTTEPEHLVPVRLRAGQVSREVPLIAVDEGSTLRFWRDALGHRLHFPSRGLVVSQVLADRLQLAPGDAVQVEVLEGDRPVRSLPLAATVRDALGMSAYLHRDELARLLGHDPQVNGVLVTLDPARQDEVTRELQRIPKVAAISRRRWTREKFRSDTAEVFLTYQLLIASFSAVIAIGVVYNNARIALASRARDLATLRILGFTRSEVSAVLLGEQAVQLLIGIPLGKLLGEMIFTVTDPELYRFPVLLTGKAISVAIAVITLAGLASAALVRRRADRLDLLAVLKARE